MGLARDDRPVGMTPSAQEKIATLHKVLDWFEANPEKSITGLSATNIYGNPTSPMSPDADCFCFTGRLVRETGMTNLYIPFGLSAWLRELNTCAGIFITLNDRAATPAERFKALREYINLLPKNGRMA